MLKVGEFDMDEEQVSPSIPTRFTQLSEQYFSLGQDEVYYSNLRALSSDERYDVLRALRDVAADNDILEDALDEPVMGVSLLRFVDRETVKNQFRRILSGGKVLTDFEFGFSVRPHEESLSNLDFTFSVTAKSNPPTNTHVIIGRNGVGKTTVLNVMAKSLSTNTSAQGRFISHGSGNNYSAFAGIVSVAFSAFDPFEPLATRINKSRGTTYTYIGLKKALSSDQNQQYKESRDYPMMSREELADMFGGSVRNILAQRGRSARWSRALATLSSDPIFADHDFGSLSQLPTENITIAAKAKFDSLSSGHKIVLLTVARLIESVQERTLVLIDEPEAHLHPPLLSALMSTLSDLLIDRNAVAIVATHSPVVLQEVPRNCVSILGRAGNFSTVQRPELETFGENVGVLTREVFGLEVTNSGYHSRLNQALEESGNDFELAVSLLGSSLGAEAKAILRTMSLARKRRGLLR